MRVEILSRLAGGLLSLRVPWTIESGPERVEPWADHTRYRYMLRRGSEERDVFVEVSNTAGAVDPRTLPSSLDEVIQTRRRSVVEGDLHRQEPPIRVVVHSFGWYVVPRDGCYEPGDHVEVNVEGEWHKAGYLRHGDPDEAVTFRDPGVVEGERRRDVAWVQRTDDGLPSAHMYQHIRGESAT